MSTRQEKKDCVATSQELEKYLPHRPPFLFVDRVTGLEPFKEIIAERHLSPNEAYFSGHFPGLPIMPGVLITEALAQACGLLLGLSRAAEAGPPPEASIFYLAASQMKFVSPAHPGQTLVLKARLERNFSGLSRYTVECLTDNRPIALGHITLAELKDKA